MRVRYHQVSPHSWIREKRLFDVTRNHGARYRKVFQCIDVHEKLFEAELDLEFLKKCETYEIYPKFFRFNLHSSSAYNNFQSELLDSELRLKTERVVYLAEQCEELKNWILRQLSLFWVSYVQNIDNIYLWCYTFVFLA